MSTENCCVSRAEGSSNLTYNDVRVPLYQAIIQYKRAGYTQDEDREEPILNRLDQKLMGYGFMHRSRADCFWSSDFDGWRLYEFHDLARFREAIQELRQIYGLSRRKDVRITIGRTHHARFTQVIADDLPLLRAGDIRKWSCFLSKLKRAESTDQPGPGRRIWSRFSEQIQVLIRGLGSDVDLKGDDELDIIDSLNEILKSEYLYSEDEFSGITLPQKARDLLGKSREALSEGEFRQLNRLLMEAAYPQEMAKSPCYEAYGEEKVTARMGTNSELPISLHALVLDEESLELRLNGNENSTLVTFTILEGAPEGGGNEPFLTESVSLEAAGGDDYLVWRPGSERYSLTVPVREGEASVILRSGEETGEVRVLVSVDNYPGDVVRGDVVYVTVVDASQKAR